MRGAPRSHSHHSWFFPSGRLRRGAAALLCCSILKSSGCEHQRREESAAKPPAITGRVHVAGRGVPHAEVRVQGDEHAVRTDKDGRFTLPVESNRSQAIAVWKEKFYIAEAMVSAADDAEPIISLDPLPDHAADGYEWVSARGGSDESCIHCHGEIVEEWETSGHAHSAANRRFLGLLEGTNWEGQVGHGWSLLDEYPEGSSVCAACHVPTLEGAAALAGDVRSPSRVAAEGVHCDFCHKVRDVNHDGIGFAHGRFGMDVLLPAEGQLFFGPLKDATRGKEAFAAVYRESRYCAACHEGVVFGVHVYSTYSEWLDSPARASGKSCQSCHMAPTGNMINIAPGLGGVDRNPQTLASHHFLPGGHAAMLRRAVRLSPRVLRTAKGEVEVDIGLGVHDVGHRVPTGFIDRHLLLVVDPLDPQRERIAADNEQGPRLSRLAGSRLEGRHGMLFGRWLRDGDGKEPAPFWRVAEQVQDNRLVPDQPVSVRFRFGKQAAYARVRLLYRRFWQEVAEEKNWPDETIVIYDQTLELAGEG